MYFCSSCTGAILVNYYCYTIIGKFSAITYQIITHAKTCLILFFGMMLFPSPNKDPDLLKWHYGGMAVTVGGMIMYYHFKQVDSSSAGASAAEKKAAEMKKKA